MAGSGILSCAKPRTHTCSHSRNSDVTWDVTILLRPIVFPATTGPSKENRCLIFNQLKLSIGFQGRVYTPKFEEGCRVYGFLLIGWRWDNRAVLQESCAQPEVTVLHWMGALVHTQELRDLYQLDMYNPWGGGTRTLPDCWTIVSWLPFLYLCTPQLL